METQKIGLLAAASVLAGTIVAAPVVWQVARNADDVATAGIEAPTVGLDAMQAELAALRAEVRNLQARVDGLDARTSIGLAGRQRPQASLAPAPATLTPQSQSTETDSLRDNFAQVVLIAGRRSANAGLTVASPSFLRQTFGLPRQDLDQECRSITNPRLQRLVSTEDVGPIRARLQAPALASLRKVFAEVQEFEPELYARIASSGSLCVRLIRGSTASASAHAYGLAVDLNIDGQLDNFADGRTQLGLILLADFFKKEGWIWGAGFSREDSMHFEVSREKIEQWRREGLL